ncbi:MAG: glutaminyl-peptide cyclotransferase [Anaerolineae bacterium]|nr:glutaminyl-peptide cyclotransferase [Anaerolineae bacterium]
MKRSVYLILVIAALLAVAGIGAAVAQSDDPSNQPVQFLVPEVLSVREHDPAAYTQGLLYYEGSLYESTGLTGESSLREVDPDTGEVLRMIDVDDQYFAEGLERVDDRLIQLTWKAETAFVYDLATFEQVDTFAYEGEGWGLCSDGRFLYMSDGTSFIDVRDPDTFELIVSMAVTVQGQIVGRFVDQNQRPLGLLNELECVGEYIYSNVWKSDMILQIDKVTGVVVGLIDASGLLTEEEQAALENPSQHVLNGIVYLPDSETFLITGKKWPKMFEVVFVPQEQ